MSSFKARVVGVLRRPWFWVAVVVLVLVFVPTVLKPHKDTSVGYELESSERGGALAFVRFADRLGVRSEISGVPKTFDSVVFVMHDDFYLMSQGQLPETLNKFVREGGTVVVANSSGQFDPGVRKVVVAQDSFRSVLEPKCNTWWTKDVKSVQTSRTPYSAALTVKPGDTACFSSDDKKQAWAVQRKVGKGQEIIFANGDFLRNELISKRDNEVLVANLLNAGHTSKIFIYDPTLDDGAIEQASNSEEESLMDLIPGAFWVAFWQLFVALIFLALWKGRRLERIAGEAPTVALPASSLVVARGELFDIAKQANDAARVLRRDGRTRLARAVGADPAGETQGLIQIIAERSNVPVSKVAAVLVDKDITSGTQLLELSQEIERLHQEVVNVR